MTGSEGSRYDGSRSGSLHDRCQVLMNVRVGSRRTSLRLHRDIWSALREICGRENLTIHDLCTRADRLRQGEPLAESVRILALTYYRDATHIAEAVLKAQWAGTGVEEEASRDAEDIPDFGTLDLASRDLTPGNILPGNLANPDRDNHDLSGLDLPSAELACSGCSAGHGGSVGQERSSRRTLTERYGSYLDKFGSGSEASAAASHPRHP